MSVWLPPSPTIFVKPTEQILSQRKLEGLEKLAEIKQWGLRNPTKFMERFIGVELLDSQNYVFNSSWDKMYALWLCSRNYGKSTMLALYYMTRGMLMNSARFYICAGTSDQSIETFEKIVSIAKNEVESFTGLTDVFRNEVVINQTNSDGFIRNPAGFTYRLYNGSFVRTLNSNVNAKRGKRAEGVCFDESGWLSEEVFQVIEPYTAQEKDFKLGGGIDITTLPRELPNQLLYASSASSVDSYFYTKYKDYSKKMFAGDPRYFVADMNCELVISATYKGKVYPVSLLSQEKIDTAMNENKEKALREYYNQFTTDGGANAVIRRADIIRNSYQMLPTLYNDTNDKLFGLFYDPARSLDNSVVLIAEFYKDPVKGWKARLVNLENFMDISKKNRTPMRTPEQIAHLKDLVLRYNGNNLDYEKIHVIAIDAGAGGGGVNIADFLMPDFYEKGHEGEEKYLHRGLIDKEYSADYVRKFPNAINKVRLLEPSKYKTLIYEALKEMVTQDLIDFPAEYNGKGYVTLIKVDEKVKENLIKRLRADIKAGKVPEEQYNEELEKRMEETNMAKTEIHMLSDEEIIALNQMDSMKEEIVNMVRKERESGKDSFELSKEKQGKLHDDRAYVLCMLAYFLQELRRDAVRTRHKKADEESIVKRLPIRRGRFSKIIG